MGTNMRVYENNSVTINAVVLNPAGAPESISGWSFEFLVAAVGTDVALFTKTTGNITQINITNAALGQLQVYIIPADTLGQRGDQWQYELKGTDTFGRAVTLAQGSFSILPTII